MVFGCLTAAWGCNSLGVCTIQRSIHFLYIHQSTHHLYPFILRGPRWLECLHSSEWEKAKVSFIYISQSSYFSPPSPPFREFAIGATSETLHRLTFFEPGWWEMVCLFCLPKFKNCMADQLLKLPWHQRRAGQSPGLVFLRWTTTPQKLLKKNPHLDKYNYYI